MWETLSALVPKIKVSRDDAPRIFSTKALRFMKPEIALCKVQASDFEHLFDAKFRHNRLQVNEAIRQVVSVSPTRVQWESKQGADLLKMTIAALSQIKNSESLSVTLNESNGLGLRFSNKSITLDVSPGSNGSCIFTIFSEDAPGNDVVSILQIAAAESIASDISNNVRSYSYSWSSSGSSPFGEMDSLLENFFGHVDPRRIQVESPWASKSEAEELDKMGVQVIIPSKSISSKTDWSTLAGYDSVKSQVEESVILSLKHPSLFEKIVSKTRSSSNQQKVISNKPKVVLFEGPPGTGKSSTAKIIANETNVPMIHIPLESVVSKWFGESEKQIAKIYELARELAMSEGASSVILFIDEIDSLVSSRDIGTPHEASKRILSVMLRQIDGYNQENERKQVQATLICATNRKKDLDPAFLSRVDASIHFGLPSEDSREKILKLYAKHLTQTDLHHLATITDGLSGRNLKDLCQSAERQWAAALIRGLNPDASEDEVDVSPPPIEIYIDAAKRKYREQVHF